MNLATSAALGLVPRPLPSRSMPRAALDRVKARRLTQHQAPEKRLDFLLLGHGRSTIHLRKSAAGTPAHFGLAARRASSRKMIGFARDRGRRQRPLPDARLVARPPRR
jgi:hypothetical protein